MAINIKKEKKKAFDEWFKSKKEWQKEQLESWLLASIKKGYSAISIQYDNPSLTEVDKRFMNSVFFKDAIQEQVPYLNAEVIKQQYTNVLGIKVTKKSLLISSDDE